jgi:hypothetical protein
MTTSLRELGRAKAAQTMISGVALTDVDYLVLADKFVANGQKTGTR